MKYLAYSNTFDAVNMSVEDLFLLVKKPLKVAKRSIEKMQTCENKFDTIRNSFLKSLSSVIDEANEQEDFLKQNLVQDHLVIAFFGETNAGKSTIIDTFRILFDERTRRRLLEKTNSSQFGRKTSKINVDTTIIGVDGTIVGDGRSDFTKTYDEYEMSIDNHKFTLIDVPGIEGNEAEYKDGIKKALQKAHCVFYVHGSDKKPNTKTTEKIKEYLNDWVSVYSIRNIRGGSEQYDEDEDRECLLTDDTLRASELSEKEFQKTLGAYYIGNINIQGMLALCSKANFSPTRKDLIGVQLDLFESFGDRDNLYTFSHFDDLVNEVRKMTVGYKELIFVSNRNKVLAVARRSISVINDCISQHKEAIEDFDSKLDTFHRNIVLTTTHAEQRLNIKSLVEREFDSLRDALYKAIDSKKEDRVRSTAKTQSSVLEDRLIRQTKEICSEVTDWFVKELLRLKRDLDAIVDLGEISISIEKISISIDANKITDEMQDFDFRSAISGATTVASVVSLFPGVGWVLGGTLVAVSALFSGLLGDDGGSKAKQKVDAIIDENSTKLIKQLNDEVLCRFKSQYKAVSNDIKQKVMVERRNVSTLLSDIELLKEDIRITINQIR